MRLMTDMQMVTLVITLLAIFMAVFLNRKSIEDMRDVLRAEMKAQMAEFRAENAVQFTVINNKLDHLLEVVAAHSEKLDKKP
jgi:hypothetical protein